MPKSWIFFLVLMSSISQWGNASITLPTDPTRHWKMIPTEHFEIIFDENQRDLAKRTAVEAERAHALVTRFLKTEKKSKTPIVIEDTTDNTNGFAQAIPYAQIHVYPTLPMANESISEYEDWIKELITHEYTHIVNFEPTSGVMGVLRFLFGGIVRPAGLLPRWYSEGLAVESESRHTQVGRGKSSFYSAMVRADVLGGTWGKTSIDQLNEPGIPKWPRGLRPYGYGYFLMHHLGEAGDDGKDQGDVYGKLNERYGSRFPFFINGPVEDIKGKDYSELLDDTYKKLDTKAKLQIESLKTKGITQTKRFKEEGFNLIGARISPDQKKLAFLASRYDEDQTIRIIERASTTQSFYDVAGSSRELFSADTISGLDWSSDSQHLVFGQTKTINRYNEFYDLFELDISNKKTKRLTSRLRAHEGVWSEFDGGKHLVFVQNNGVKNSLAECTEFPCQTAKVLFAPEEGHRIASPRAYGSLVVFSHRDNHGHEWIESFDLKTKKLSALTESKTVGVQNFPALRKNGNVLLADNSTGVMNIYVTSVNSPLKLTPLTNSATYFTSPEYDESTGELLVSELTEKGFALSSVEAKYFFSKTGAGELAKVGSLSTFPPPPAEPPAPNGSNSPKATGVSSTNLGDEKNYSGLSYLFPQYWFPFFYSVPGGSLFDISTSVADPLNHHSAALSVGFDTRTNKPREAIQYTYGGLPFLIDAGFVNQAQYLSGLNSTYDTTDVFLGTQHFIAGLSNDWMMGPSFVYSQTVYPSRPTENLGGVAYQLSYNNIDAKKDHMISPEKGGSFTISEIYYPKEWATTSYATTKASGNIYLAPKFFPKRHVFSAQVSGQYTPDQRSILIGSAQAGGELLWSVFPGVYNVRGYPIGEFLGWSLATGNFEYRFPLAYVFAGPGTFPLFQNNWHAALVYDVITLKGGYFDSNGFLRATSLGTFYSSAGVEIRTDLKLFYFLPLTLKLGIHRGFSSEAMGRRTF